MSINSVDFSHDGSMLKRRRTKIMNLDSGKSSSLHAKFCMEVSEPVYFGIQVRKRMSQVFCLCESWPKLFVTWDCTFF